MKVCEGFPARTPVTSAAAIFCLISIISAHPLQASYTYYFDAFTYNGAYCDDLGTNIFTVVSEGIDSIDFTFYNENPFPSSIATIYFDNGSLDELSAIINGPGTNFGQSFPGPGNLPAGRTLDPPFHADFSVGALAAPPKNGINSLSSGEWIRVSFNLPASETLDSINGELISGQMRIGMHIIALPDGSSESAVMVVPEPATLLLIGLGVPILSGLRKRKI